MCRSDLSGQLTVQKILVLLKNILTVGALIQVVGSTPVILLLNFLYPKILLINAENFLQIVKWIVFNSGLIELCFQLLSFFLYFFRVEN